MSRAPCKATFIKKAQQAGISEEQDHIGTLGFTIGDRSASHCVLIILASNMSENNMRSTSWQCYKSTTKY